MSQSPIRSVCVYCGSRPGDNPAFAATARETGQRLAQAGYRLVYGAGDVGIMGAVADGAREVGGARLGVIPTHLFGREAQSRADPSLLITETMHERKKVMFMNADAVLALPGGPGTLDELFEVLTWRQLGLHSKPVLLLDIDGYWQPLVALIDHVIARGFADASFAGFLTTCTSPDEIMAVLAREIG
ncbi:MAG: TIGR00730 family Rossman fold protein [Pseudomonadota bacterium]